MAILPNDPAIRIYWHAPEPIFAARVNLASPVYPIADIPFDGVTTGAYTDTHADMFFTLGSAPGLDDYGRGRLRQQATANLLKIGRSSQGTEDGQVDIVNNAYISSGTLTWTELDGWWTDAGTIESLLAANQLVAQTGANRMDV